MRAGGVRAIVVTGFRHAKTFFGTCRLDGGRGVRQTGEARQTEKGGGNSSAMIRFHGRVLRKQWVNDPALRHKRNDKRRIGCKNLWPECCKRGFLTVNSLGMGNGYNWGEFFRGVSRR